MRSDETYAVLTNAADTCVVTSMLGGDPNKVAASYAGGVPGFEQPVIAGEVVLDGDHVRFDDVVLIGITLQRVPVFSLDVASIGGMKLDRARIDRFDGDVAKILDDDGRESAGSSDTLFFEVVFAQATIGNKNHLLLVYGVIDAEPYVAGFAVSAGGGSRVRAFVEQRRASRGLEPLLPFDEWWRKEAGRGPGIALDPGSAPARRAVAESVQLALAARHLDVAGSLDDEFWIEAAPVGMRVLDHRLLQIHARQVACQGARRLLAIPDPTPSADELARWIIAVMRSMGFELSSPPRPS